MAAFDFLIHEAIARHAAHRPGHPALACDGRVMTYGELHERSNQLAWTLLELGLRPGGRVGIFMNKSLEMGVALYGILKSGGAFVPLDPLMPVERLDFILGDCGIEHLVTGDLQAPVLRRWVREIGSNPGLHVLGLAETTELQLSVESWSAVHRRSTSDPGAGLIDQDLAYLMYTSGSTGAPKGMMHTHHGSLSYARWGANHLGLTPEDRVASHAPLHFDLSIFDFFSTSQAGGTVVLVPEPVTKFPASWTAYLEAERISVVFTVPYTLTEMLSRGVLESRNLSALRWVLFGGEPAPPAHLRALMARLPHVRFTNVYGPAEAPSCTCYDLPGPPSDDTPIPIGTVSQNSADLIVDDRGEPVPSDEVGELLIRSSTLMKGYWNRPELNRDAFLDRPGFGPLRERYYRTGDLVRRDADGLLHFVGRKDRMIKTRGHRVELDEVEAALAGHPSVHTAAAYDVPDDQGSKRILAAAVIREGHSADEQELRQHCESKLPRYALPERIEIRSGLPRTTSGKVDHKRLRDEALTVEAGRP
ncbi:MAG: amino acid adenylation domain-containing protein [Gemmatimonadetes bacterium]|nr:amino acid adenylation domain-containing protein [Gemmatimonadota bacterium]